MKLINRYYNKIRSHRQKDVSIIVRKEVLKHLYKINALDNTKSLVSDNNNNIVISLTSVKNRLRNIHIVLDSISRQTIKPSKVILWLSESLNHEVLPETIKNYINTRGLIVEFVKDIGPHTKLLYSLKSFPESIIITIDDDIIYPHDFIETLYSNYLKYPGTICCNAAREFRLSSSYCKWKKVSNINKTEKNLLPLGVNGILYFPNCFNSDVFNIDLFSRLCPTADDIWFRMMSYLNNIDITLTGAYKDLADDFIPLDIINDNSLAVTNVLGKGNDTQMRAVIDHYDLRIN